MSWLIVKNDKRSLLRLTDDFSSDTMEVRKSGTIFSDFEREELSI